MQAFSGHREYQIHKCACPCRCFLQFFFVYRIIAVAKQRLKDIVNETGGEIDLSNNESLPDILIDLACYSYEPLIQRSLMLLDRYYTSKSDIFLKALPARLLVTPESIRLFDTIEETLFLRLMRFLKGSEEADTSVIQELIKYCWLENEAEGYEPHRINQDIILSFGQFTYSCMVLTSL